MDFFFVLSGFLITSILLSTKEATPRSYFWSFYARRVLRIFPLYILAVAAFFWVSLPYIQSHDAMFRGALSGVHSSEQVWYWSYLVNWHDAGGHIIGTMAHFWSLSVEEQFYLIWPAVVFFCALRYFMPLCVAIGAFSLIFRVILVTGSFVAPELLHEFIHRATITRLDTLAVGALIAAVVRNPDWTQLLRRQIKLLTPAAIGAYVITWVAAKQGSPFLIESFGYLLIAIAYGCIVFVCVTDQGSNHPVCRVARWRSLRSVGHYSYAIYIFHLVVIRCLHALTVFIVVPRLQQVRGIERIPPVMVSLFGMAVCLGTSYLVAFASWHLFEKHFLRLKKYFPYQVSSPASERETQILEEVAIAG